jgi:hypothetical protein
MKPHSETWQFTRLCNELGSRQADSFGHSEWCWKYSRHHYVDNGNGTPQASSLIDTGYDVPADTDEKDIKLSTLLLHWHTPSWRNPTFQYFILPVWFLIPARSPFLSFTLPFHFTLFHLAFRSFFASISSYLFPTSTLPPPPHNFPSFIENVSLASCSTSSTPFHDSRVLYLSVFSIYCTSVLRISHTPIIYST